MTRETGRNSGRRYVLINSEQNEVNEEVKEIAEDLAASINAPNRTSKLEQVDDDDLVNQNSSKGSIEVD
jgi:hypothetical protein